MVSDGTYLYFATNGAAGSSNAEKVYQYRLSDWAYINNVTVTGADASYPHAIAYDGGALFITTTAATNNLNKVYRVDLPGLTLNASSTTIFSTMCDEMVATGDKLYIGKESSDGYILVIDKPGYGIVKDSIYSGISAECYGVFYDGMYVWATMAGSPGGLSRIDPTTGSVAYMVFGTGYDNTNELSFHAGRMLLTFYQTNFGVGRICLPDMIPLGSGGGMANPMTASQDMIVGGTSGAPTRLPKGNDGDVLVITAGVIGWAASGGGSMVYPGAGIPVSTGSAWTTSIPNNSANWNTAYTHSTLTSGNPHGVTKADVGLSLVENTALSTWAGSTYLTTLGTLSSLSVDGIINVNPSDLQIYGNTGEGFIAGLANNVAIGVKDGGGSFEYVMKANYGAGLTNFEALYNGSKVFETDADGVNIPTGKSYQVNGVNGISGTYESPIVQFSGGVAVSAEGGHKSIVVQVYDPSEQVAANNAVAYVSIPHGLSGWSISNIQAHSYSGTSGSIGIDVLNSNGVESTSYATVFSAIHYISSGYHDSKSVATSTPSLNLAVDDGYTIRVDIKSSDASRYGLDVRIDFTK
jgi:hypothetical protein